MTRLNNHNLGKLTDDVAKPQYDRKTLTPGIVHIGVGGFHRAHQAMYLDALMNQGEAWDWGIVGVGVMPGDKRMQQALAAQDYLYTLVVKHLMASMSHGSLAVWSIISSRRKRPRR